MRLPKSFVQGSRNAVVLALVLLPTLLAAQWSNLRSRYAVATKPLQTLDSVTIAPPLLAVSDSASGQILPLDLFALRNNALVTDTTRLAVVCPTCRTLRVTYRTLAYDLSRPVRRLDTLAIRRATGYDRDIAFDYTPFTGNNSGNLLAQPGLQSNGSYTRGLSAGNNQNLVFNSNLNLQFDGKLGNDLAIRGALSDNSVPLQPDGTTRQLQEFDRIYLEIQRKDLTLAAGDLDFVRPTGYFSNYFKRVQGARVSLPPPAPPLGGSASLLPAGSGSALPPASAPNGTVRNPSSPPTGGLGGAVGAGVSKGRFARQTIRGQEGNQGPYRLQGAEGERFIIVLAGTEKVFADGQLLRRGLDDDYVIDYNLGEVTFTPKRLITKDIRIIVEFEYAVQNFLRSTATANVEWANRRGRAWLNFYSEQDSRNATGGAQDLSGAERFRLAQVGDSLQNAFASGIDTLQEFDAARVLYRAVDTVICGGVVTQVLVFSTNADSARYAARFSEVLPGQGNYVQAPNGANGRVYRWVAPDPVTCQPQGNFEPVVRLIAPEQRQLHTVGADFQVFKNTNVFFEGALSSRDYNRLSPLGNADNLGGAGLLRVKHRFWGEKSAAAKRGWQLGVNADLEVTTRTFQPLNPYRPAEFTRDWNTDPSANGNQQPTVAAERIVKSGVVLERKNWGAARYELGAYQRAGQYDGQRHFANLRVQRKGWNLLSEINLLQTAGLAEKSTFSRPKLDLSRAFFNPKKEEVWRVGVYGERERNARRSTAVDTLTRASFWYDLGKIYLQMPDNQRVVQVGAYLSQRNDYAPTGNFFTQSTSATEANLNGKWLPPTVTVLPNATPKPRLLTQQLSWNLTHRQLRVLAPELTTTKAQRSYLGRVDYNFAGWKNALAFTTGYELGSGQSPKLEFNYLRVNPGEGQYSWIDRNRDSILTVDEMEVAVFQDQATFVRVAVTTPEYVRTNNAVFNQNLRLEPRLWWGSGPQKGARRLVARLAAQSTWQVNRRVLADVGGTSPWNPFALAVADSALVSVSSTLRNVLFVNRANPRWDASLTQSDNRSRLLVTTGFESRQVADWTLHARANLGKRWSAEGDAVQLRRQNDSENFDNRDYDIGGWDVGPQCTWLPSRGFRLLGRTVWKTRQNSLGAGEKATQTDYNVELTWNPQAKPATGSGFRAATSLRSKFTLADIRYTGEANTAVAFAMLEGLQNGRNLLWSLTLDRQLSKSMQLNLSYEGRRTGQAARVVHVARAQVRAVF